MTLDSNLDTEPWEGIKSACQNTLKASPTTQHHSPDSVQYYGVIVLSRQTPQAAWAKHVFCSFIILFRYR
jgi:hypothetical protein